MPIGPSTLRGEAVLRKACHSTKLQIASLLILLVSIPLSAQEPQTTGEAKLNAGETSAGTTTVGGYGNMLFRRDVNAGLSTIDMERVVLFVGHRFSTSISFLSELEVEHAKVEGGEEGGEVALEQAYVKFDFDPRHYLVAGLFIPQIGIINENHLPIDFNGNERPIVERLVIPTTWRELGVGFYGLLEPIGMRYALGLMNGLNSSGFSNGSLIRGGRAEGSRASANNLALTGAVQFDRGPVTLQISGYYGGTVGLSSEEADTLGLESGAFGTPVAMGEADIQYSSNGLSLKALGVVVSIPDAGRINTAYDNNTPELGYGAYVEAGYDLFRFFPDGPAGELVAFARFEKLDLNARIPANATANPSLNQTHVICGLSYLPDPRVVVKGDLRFAEAGERNTFVNLGVGFAF